MLRHILIMSDTSFVLPSKIPWDTLKGKELEECVYWLLQGMGARDLQWRVGGCGGGAPDQGRDLEANFYSSGPDGEINAARWWIETKGRTSTVEKDAVTSAANNARLHKRGRAPRCYEHTVFKSDRGLGTGMEQFKAEAEGSPLG
jgi:hypothetical protein